MKHLGVFLAGIAVGWLILAVALERPPRGWEYRVLYSPDPARTSRVLDSLGAEGWRLVTANGPILYLERVVTR